MRPSRAQAQCGRGLRSRKLHTTTGEPRLNIKTTSCDQNVPFIKNTLTHTNTKLRTHTFAKTQPYMHVCSSCMFWKLNVELLQSLTRSVSQLGKPYHILLSHVSLLIATYARFLVAYPLFVRNRQ